MRNTGVAGVSNWPGASDTGTTDGAGGRAGVGEELWVGGAAAAGGGGALGLGDDWGGTATTGGAIGSGSSAGNSRSSTSNNIQSGTTGTARGQLSSSPRSVDLLGVVSARGEGETPQNSIASPQRSLKATAVSARAVGELRSAQTSAGFSASPEDGQSRAGRVSRASDVDTRDRCDGGAVRVRPKRAVHHKPSVMREIPRWSIANGEQSATPSRHQCRPRPSCSHRHEYFLPTSRCDRPSSPRRCR
jgi:hypothetical protein